MSDVAAATAVSARALLAIEGGRSRPDTALLLRLLDHYGCGIDDILPPRRLLDPAGFEGMSSSQILQRHVAQVRQWRAGGNAGLQRFRASDVDVLVGILGTDADDIERRLIALTGCSRRTARAFRRILVCSLLAATGVGLAQGVAAAREGASPGSGSAVPNVETVAACAGTGIPASEATTNVDAGPGGTRVSFTIPPSVGVRFDDSGRAVALRTNTRQPPACDAVWYSVRSGSGDIAEIDDVAEINTIIASVMADDALPTAGNWSPGVWYTLR